MMRVSKYLLVVFVLASFLLFASCGATQRKVEEQENVALENLEGYWI